MKIERTVPFKNLKDDEDGLTRVLHSNQLLGVKEEQEGKKDLVLSRWMLISSIQSLCYFKQHASTHQVDCVMPFPGIVIEFEGFKEAESLQVQLILFFEYNWGRDFYLENMY